MTLHFDNHTSLGGEWEGEGEETGEKRRTEPGKKRPPSHALQVLDGGYSRMGDSLPNRALTTLRCSTPAGALRHQGSWLGHDGCNAFARKLFNCCRRFVAQNI